MAYQWWLDAIKNPIRYSLDAFYALFHSVFRVANITSANTLAQSNPEDSRPTHPLNESIRCVDNNSWLIADRLLLSLGGLPSSDQPSWSDGNGSFFVLSEVANPPESRPLPDKSGLRKVYDVSDVSAVWRAGEAFIKVKKITMPNATREHVTLDYLHRKGPLGFDIPTVHFHAEFGGRYYIILSRLPGPTLAEAWPDLDETIKQGYVCRVAAICEQLAAWKGDSVSGVDGGELSDLFLTKREADDNHDPQSLLHNCKELEMDCSSLGFYHCDLGPGNIVVSPAKGSIGILDWETAGYVPREWIRTKFRLSSGMDLPVGDAVARTDWRRRVSQRLGDMGFADVVGRWSVWWGMPRDNYYDIAPPVLSWFIYFR